MSAKTQDRKFEGAALAPRVKTEVVAEAVSAIREKRRTMRAAYAGGLPAEAASEATLSRSLRAQIRRIILGGIGRRIDLQALLTKSRADKSPLWAIADPAHPVGPGNGRRQRGCARIAKAIGARDPNGYETCRAEIPVGKSEHDGFEPGGMPALPPRVRELATDPKIRKRANWVGVLYQPEEWTHVNPDPALVVEWTDLPGQYFALAIWGGDRAEIEEFVD